MKTEILNPYTLDPDAHSKKHGTHNDEPSMTVQADKDATDINNIVKQFGLTHELPYGRDVPVYDDFTDAPSDYHAAQNFIIAADETFMELPAEIRSEFDNDAGNFLNFVYDPSNRERAEKLGLVPPYIPPSSDGGNDSPPPSDDGGNKP